MKHLRHPATVIAAVALFIALGGGAAAYATGLISGSQIKDHSIAQKKLTNKDKATLIEWGFRLVTYHKAGLETAGQAR